MMSSTHIVSAARHPIDAW